MTFPPEFWEALWLTLRLAFVTTAILLMTGLPIAQWMARGGRVPLLAEVLLTLPLALPPTVIGFYLLVIFAPQAWLGELWLRVMGSPLAFSFAGLVTGSVIYSLPFAIQPFRAGLAGVPRELQEAARNSGASELRTFLRVTLPLAKNGIAAGVVLSFAHTLGEFGVVLMLGGSIPGRTKVLSITLYDEVQKMDYAAAHAYSAVLLGVAFVLILTVTVLQRRGAAGN
jgi:molybdate transport system permease protein